MMKAMLSLIVVLLLSVVATPALATPPEGAEGTFWEGDLGGNDDGSFSYYADGTFNGVLTIYFSSGNTARVVCDPCTVDGKTGTVVLNLVFMNYKHERGNWNSLYATGELEGLHFQGKHERALDSPNGIYYGKIHFDPQ